MDSQADGTNYPIIHGYIDEMHDWDFRGYTSATQIDTFCLSVSGVAGNISNSAVTLHWPSDLLNYGTKWELKKRQGTSGSNYTTVVPNMEMDPDSSWTDANRLRESNVRYLIIKYGAHTPEHIPIISLNTGSLDFGNVAVGDSKTLSVIATNTGTASASIQGVTSIAGYTVIPNPPTTYPIPLAQGASRSFNVTFTPSSGGFFAGNIVFSHNATGGTTNLAVNGSGQVPGTLQFKTRIIMNVSNCTRVDTLFFGVSGDGPGGTILDNTYEVDEDSAYGTLGQWMEEGGPPATPYDEFSSFWCNVPNHPASWDYMHDWDFRGYTSAAQIDTFCFGLFNCNPGNYITNGQITLHWPSDLFSYGAKWELKKRQGTSGSNYVTVVSNMETDPDQSWADVNAEKAYGVWYLIIRYGVYAQENTSILSLSSGWNLVSVPRIQTNDSAHVIFRSKSGSMFEYNTALRDYQMALILANGPGYWLNNSITDTNSINGTTPGSLIVTVAKAGWVLVGSRGATMQVSSLVLSDGALRLGSAFRYDAATKNYQAVTKIEPGDAVWINVDKACTITLP